MAIHTVSGYVKDKDGNGISRIVRLYNRSTKALVTETQSDTDGFVELELDDTKEYFAIALKEFPGLTSPNITILDRLVKYLV